ncbi:MAG: VPLPA-CTERM sorting domain-containing protein [Gammaproteobacteria bacterium]|nr:VPLPA-CTERM sorting domain-containing protein [Gammaproteobacteria bacterium]
MRIRSLAAGLLAIFGFVSQASAVSIQYELTPLGGSQYRYIYTVSNDGSLGTGIAIGLFDVMFDPALYQESTLAISTPAPLASGWDQLLLASAPGVPAAYDALALAGGIADGTSLGGFAVDFTWLGAGTPGSQAFAIYDPASFALLEEGATRNLAPVPLPAAAWLLGSGLVALLGFCRRRRQQPLATV